MRFPSLCRLMLDQLLEVVVSTEADTVQQLQTPVVAVARSLRSILGVTSELTVPRVLEVSATVEVAQVSNERNLVRYVVSDTRLNEHTQRVGVLLQTFLVSSAVGQTTVNESSEVASLHESITQVGLNAPSVSVSSTGSTLILVAQSNGNSELVVEVVTNLRLYEQIVVRNL